MQRLPHLLRILTGVLAAAALPAILVFGRAQFSPPPEPTIHEVAPGETLTRIAGQYGVSVAAIMEANGLSNPDALQVGQQLVIPIPVEADNIHVVQRGETLAQIAARYGLTPAALMDANDLSSINDITAGQQLTLPEGEAVETVPVTLGRGDSLYRIALVYGVTVNELLAANRLSSANAVYPGLTISVPVAGTTPTEPRTHTVIMGDTLASIAVAYGVTVDGLIAANDLPSTGSIYAGQTLTIPEEGAPARPPQAVTATSHVVQRGETLSQIALRYGVTIAGLAAANNLANPDALTPGTTLSIPGVQAGEASVLYANVGAGRCEGVTPEKSGSGYFIKPVRPGDYIYTRGFTGTHAGVDLAADTGTPVVAADGGVVVYAGWNSAGYGNLVILDHGNGWRSYYAHLNDVYTTCAEWVARGAAIGEVGSTGNSTGPHLHFELLRYGIAVDPAGYIRFR